jgi:DNA helicase-2/ATP-dependent DNA helicase PcrA
MSVDTPQELEEERRLFYVGITRAKEKLFISYSGSRYRWGLLTHCNPSRFISEINEEFLELPFNYGRSGIPDLTGYGQNKQNIHKQVSQGNTIFPGAEKKLVKISESHDTKQRKKVDSSNGKISIGSRVEHPRFGTGSVDNIEGIPPNIKATVIFDNHGKKQLLLKFAKLKVIE